LSDSDPISIFSRRSTSLEDAQARAKEVLTDFQKETEEEHTQIRQKADRHLQANKVLAKALHILKSKLAENQSRTDELREQLRVTEERANNAEHTANVLRWHLQASAGGSSSSGGIRTPPDVF